MKLFPQVPALFIGLSMIVSFRPADGAEVVVWGNNYYYQTNLPPGLTNVVGIAAGALHSLALRSDGTVAAWGWVSNVPPGLSDAVAVAASYNNSIAVRSNGTVAAFYDQTNVPPGLTEVVAAGVGWYHGVALRANGTVVAWGDNSRGETNVPKGLTNVIAIGVGARHTLALRANGTVVAWGANFGSATNVPVGLSNVVAVDATRFLNVALRSDGTLVSWGRYWNGTNEVLMTIPAHITNVTAVSIGEAHGLALRADGELIAWGDSSLGIEMAAITNIPPAVAKPMAFAAGWYHNVALIGDGPPLIARPLVNRTVLAGETTSFRVSASGGAPLSFQWRLNGTNIPGATNSLLMVDNVVPAKTGVYSVTVSNASGVITNSASLGVTPGVITTQPQSQVSFLGASVTLTAKVSVAASSTFQWHFNGTNLPGATNSTLELVDVQPANAGVYSLVVSNVAGTFVSQDATLRLSSIVMWGPRFKLELSNIVALAAGGFRYLGLRSDRTVVAWANGDFVPTAVPPDATNVIAFGMGYQYRLASRPDGSVLAWGDNYGTNYYLPTPPDLTNVAAFASGDGFAIALRENGTVTVWGDTTWGLTNVPAGLSNVVAISAGLYHALALKADGTIVGWGNANVWGPTEQQPAAVPPGLSNIVAIASGFVHNVALRADGTVVGWGSNGCDQTNVPSGLQATAITAMPYHSVARRSDGTVMAWGGWCDPEFGPSGGPMVPEGLTNVLAMAGDAALVGEQVTLLAPQWTSVRLDGGVFKAALPTLLGKTYVIERRNSLSDAGWQFVRVIAGRSETVDFRMPFDAVSAFYRIRRMP